MTLVWYRKGLTAGSTRRCSACDVPQQETGITILSFTAKDTLVVVLEGKVERLRGEVSDDIGSVPSPERLEPFFALGISIAPTRLDSLRTHVDLGYLISLTATSFAALVGTHQRY
jgi:hypothetical protein